MNTQELMRATACAKRRNGREGTAGLAYVAKYRRGHVQVFGGRRLRYLVTGYFHLTNSGHIETICGPMPNEAERRQIFKAANEAMRQATAQIHGATS